MTGFLFSLIQGDDAYAPAVLARLSGMTCRGIMRSTTPARPAHCLRLRGVLRLILKGLVSWKAVQGYINRSCFCKLETVEADGAVPIERLRQMLAFLRQDCTGGFRFCLALTASREAAHYSLCTLYEECAALSPLTCLKLNSKIFFLTNAQKWLRNNHKHTGR